MKTHIVHIMLSPWMLLLLLTKMGTVELTTDYMRLRVFVYNGFLCKYSLLELQHCTVLCNRSFCLRFIFY